MLEVSDMRFRPRQRHVEELKRRAEESPILRSPRKHLQESTLVGTCGIVAQEDGGRKSSSARCRASWKSPERSTPGQ